MKMKREDIRNIAIIVHVDHGKTTLVGQLLRQSGALHVNQEVQERVMDSNGLEREKGVTILSKDMAVFYKDTKINVIDTPGHADFGGEAGRVLKMVDSVVLVVDAHERPMSQIKFVLQKALDLNLSVIVCINKIGRSEARPADVIDETPELMTDLDVTDEQLDCPFIYASARGGFTRYKIEDPEVGMSPLFETIISHIPALRGDPDVETQVLISTIDYNKFVGRIGIGRVDNGGLRVNQECVLVNHHKPDKFKKIKIGKLYGSDGLKRVEVQGVGIGFVVAISGIVDIHIGDTICIPNNPEPTPFQKMSEPTIAVYFMVDDSPLAGQEDKFIVSHHLRDRLFKELNTGVSLWVEETDSADCFKVPGRDELHPFVLTENMRREGSEFAVSEAEAFYEYDERNRRLEPTELAYADVPEEYTGVIIRKLTSRKGVLRDMSQAVGGHSRLEFSIPSRGPIGYHGDFLTDIKGNGILNTIFNGYAEYKGDLFYRQTGSPTAFEAGKAIIYDLFNAQERDTLFIGLGAKVYSGMVIGQSPEAEDIEINACKTEKLTNTRSSSADEALKLTSPKIVSLGQVLDLIDTGELLEVTPKSLRIREKILDPTLRKRVSLKNKQIKIDIL